MVGKDSRWEKTITNKTTDLQQPRNLASRGLVSYQQQVANTFNFTNHFIYFQSTTFCLQLLVVLSRVFDGCVQSDFLESRFAVFSKKRRTRQRTILEHVFLFDALSERDVDTVVRSSRVERELQLPLSRHFHRTVLVGRWNANHGSGQTK